jgi:hypothetical protein
MLKLIIYETQRYWKCILAFEVILEKAQQAEFWIAPDFSSLKQMSDSNPHYQNLNHLKIKKSIFVRFK